ncbi:MAG: ABC transporter ATP-binding protein [Planctomycetota bacterium]|jgi:ABC-2 type transport system ATP-binding protein
MIKVRNLTKWYGRTLAVDDISFSVGEHTVVGFLGPNGAGKTTTLRILTCYQPATSGSAKVSGHDVFTESLQVRQIVGYMPENVPLYPEMRVREYLTFRAALRGIPARGRAAAVDRVCEQCWLSTPEDMTGRRADQLSRGYRQRVGLADCLLHQPKVLVLDEPTIGLDPTQVRAMRDLIRQLGHDRTILLSSHILAEVEQVCGQIIIISGGQLVAEGTPAELRRQVTGASRIIVEAKGGEPEQMAKIIGDLRGVAAVERSRAGNWTRLAIRGPEDADLRPLVASTLLGKGFQVRRLTREIASLEDFFVHITYEQSMRVGDGEVTRPAPQPADAAAS